MGHRAKKLSAGASVTELSGVTVAQWMCAVGEAAWVPIRPVLCFSLCAFLVKVHWE